MCQPWCPSGWADDIITGSCRHAVSVLHPFYVYMLMSTKDQDHAMSLIVILELWLLILSLCKLSYTHINKHFMRSPVSSEIKGTLWKVVLWFTVFVRPPPMYQALEPSGGWNPRMSKVIQGKGYRKWGDLCPTRGYIPPRWVISGWMLDRPGFQRSQKSKPVCQFPQGWKELVINTSIF